MTGRIDKSYYHFLYAMFGRPFRSFSFGKGLIKLNLFQRDGEAIAFQDYQLGWMEIPLKVSCENPN